MVLLRRLVSLLVFVAVSIGNAETYRPRTPDPGLTSGSLCSPSHGDFEGYRYGEKIPYCTRNVNHDQKAQIYDNYGVPKSVRMNYTIDHLIPLSIGGDNSDENLWPEHRKIKETRMNLELDVYHQVQAGTMTQAEAIEIITYEKMNPPLGFVDVDELLAKAVAQ